MPRAVAAGVVTKGKAAKDKKGRAVYRHASKNRKVSTEASGGAAKRVPANRSRSKQGQRSRLQRLFKKSIRLEPEKEAERLKHVTESKLVLKRHGKKKRQKKMTKRKASASAVAEEEQPEHSDEEESFAAQLLSRSHAALQENCVIS